jgi:HAD superfamily hydrolase (TIGR01509 family)
MIKGIIFDMDGVIIDSNHIHYENWSDVFRKRFNKTIPVKEFAEHLGESPKEFTENMIRIAGVDSSYEELFGLVRENYRRLRSKIILKKGIKEVLPILKKKYRIALATGAGKENAIDTMETFGIGDYFDYIVAGDEVKRAKPDPEIFLKAAKMLGLEPFECIVIEDAKMGIIAAKNAGMKVISIPDDLTKHQDHGLADLNIDSISGLTAGIIAKL